MGWSSGKFEAEVLVVVDRPKALCVRDDYGRETWVPRFAMSQDSQKVLMKTGDQGTLSIPMDLAQEKGLDTVPAGGVKGKKVGLKPMVRTMVEPESEQKRVDRKRYASMMSAQPQHEVMREVICGWEPNPLGYDQWQGPLTQAMYRNRAEMTALPVKWLQDALKYPSGNYRNDVVNEVLVRILQAIDPERS